MLKRIFFVIAASLLMLGIIGCACSNGTAAPTPTASMRPVSTPESVPTPGASASTSPDVGGSASPDAGTGTGTGTGMGAGTTIPNFKEGTEVSPEDVPEIKTAVETKYSGATIKTIRHALQNGQQVYEVELEQNGKIETIYVQPDGTILPAGTVNP